MRCMENVLILQGEVHYRAGNIQNPLFITLSRIPVYIHFSQSQAL